jgi:hypothetical protein
VYVLIRLFIMLLLNETTLFYFSLGDQARPQGKVSGVIKDWAEKVSRSAQPPSKGFSTSSGTSQARTAKSVSSAFNSATSVPTSFRSTTSAAVKDDKAKIASKTSSKQLTELVKLGGFESEDETNEREAALSSPIKGGKRLTSVVRIVTVVF